MESNQEFYAREAKRRQEIRETLDNLISKADCDSLELVPLYHNRGLHPIDVERALETIKARKNYLLEMKKIYCTRL